MKQIYLELVFLDNLLLDFILLFFCCRISEKRVNFVRLLAGAAIGGLYSALALPLPCLTSPWIKFPVAALLCLPLGIRPFRLYLRRLLLFFLVSFLFGGILFAFLCAKSVSCRFPAISAIALSSAWIMPFMRTGGIFGQTGQPTIQPPLPTFFPPLRPYHLPAGDGGYRKLSAGCRWRRSHSHTA